MTDRQTRVITESQTGKMAGRNKVRQDSNMQISGQDSNRQDRKERSRDCKRKMGAKDRLAKRQTDQ